MNRNYYSPYRKSRKESVREWAEALGGAAGIALVMLALYAWALSGR
jgi:hypothetical protein